MNLNGLKPGGLITFTSDFGTADGYVGAVKGCILSIAPQVRLVDISHEISPQNVVQGAWCLKRAAPRFPAGTIHLAVVDPDVGSARTGIVMETERFLLVGPDNGLLFLAAREAGIRRVIAIDEAHGAWRKSETFDALHLFAPVAAHLAAGMGLGDVGPDISDWVELERMEPRMTRNMIEGRILFFDRFGNGITNIARELCRGDPALAEYGTRGRAAIHTHYAAIGHDPGCAGASSVGAIWNSDGLLELAAYGGSARERAGLEEGTRVRVYFEPEQLKKA